MSLRDTIFGYLLRRQSKRAVTMRTWESVHTVAVLYDRGDEAMIMKQLSDKNKHIDFFTLPSKHDICWLTQRPKEEVLNQIRDYHYDLLLDLTQESSLTMQYMAMYIRADFKVGRHIRAGIHDMTINTPAQQTPSYLLEQILRYLHMLTTKQEKA